MKKNIFAMKTRCRYTKCILYYRQKLFYLDCKIRKHDLRTKTIFKSLVYNTDLCSISFFLNLKI